MVRKQVYLTPAQDRLLRRTARRSRRTEADIIREALDRALGQPGVGAPAGDALWGLVGVASEGDVDLSERIDDVVYGPRKK